MYLWHTLSFVVRDTKRRQQLRLQFFVVEINTVYIITENIFIFNLEQKLNDKKLLNHRWHAKIYILQYIFQSK